MVQMGTTHLKVKTKSLNVSTGVGRTGLDSAVATATPVHVFLGKMQQGSLVLLLGTSRICVCSQASTFPEDSTELPRTNRQGKTSQGIPSSPHNPHVTDCFLKISDAGDSLAIEDK